MKVNNTLIFDFSLFLSRFSQITLFDIFYMVFFKNQA